MANEVYANMMEVSCKAADGKSICAFPDVCFTPPLTPATPPGVPIPYPNTGLASDTADGSSTVKISGKEVMLKNKSHFKKSMGDEAGAAPKKGVLTSKNMGKVYFNAWSMDVKVEGENVVRMLDLTTHNHGSQPGNTPPFPYLDKVAPAAPKAEQAQTGTLKVKVIDAHSGDAVDKATVTLGRKTLTTGASGEVEFPGLPPGGHTVEVEKHFTEADHVSLIVHYPRVTIGHEARSEATAGETVPAGGSATLTVKLDVWRVVPDLVFHRRHIELGGDDKYGHWWTCVDGSTSYGWWPKYPMGHRLNRVNTPPTPPAALPADAGRLAQAQHLFSSAVYAARRRLFEMRESSLVQTFRGVEGELNGQTSFGGTATADPHAMHGDAGNEQYQPVVHEGRADADIRATMNRFARAYSGGWSWRFELGNHCHTFQKKLMAEADLPRLKKLK
jgi:hypothetical protein